MRTYARRRRLRCLTAAAASSKRRKAGPRALPFLWIVMLIFWQYGSSALAELRRTAVALAEAVRPGERITVSSLRIVLSVCIFAIGCATVAAASRPGRLTPGPADTPPRADAPSAPAAGGNRVG